MYLLGIDVGSSTIKTGIYACDGRFIGSYASEYKQLFPKPGLKEIEPGVIWEKTVACIRGVVAQTGVDPREILAVSPSVIGEEVGPFDKEGHPLYNFIEGMDQRENHYAAVIDMWRREFDLRDLYERTGVTLTILPSIHKMIWIKNRMPEIYRNVYKFACVEDYVIFKLCGCFATDYSLAGRTMAFNRNTKKWDAEILAAAGIRETMMVEAHNAGTVVGNISAAAAAETGLPRETKVVTGGHDQCCAALGAGVAKHGIAFNGLGYVESIGVAADYPVSDPQAQEKHQSCYPHVVKDQYLVLGLSMAFGLAIRWLRDNIYKNEPGGSAAYDAMMTRAAGAPRGCNGLFFLPHFQGSSTGVAPAFNSKSRAALIGLREFHHEADIERAVLEGLCFETRSLIQAMETEFKVKELRATGGPSKSPFLMQLKSDITGKKVKTLATNDAGIIGAVILAGIGAGVYRDYDEALGIFYRENHEYLPDTAEQRFYERRYLVYERLYPNLENVFDEIDMLTKEE